MALALNKCFCAFCKSERIVYRNKHVSILDASMALFASQMLSFLIWQDFDPRSFILFAASVCIAEVFVLIRWRVSIACPHCGFDPVLYRRKPQDAAVRVNTHLAARRNDPFHTFAAPLKIPFLIKKTSALLSSQSPTQSQLTSLTPLTAQTSESAVAPKQSVPTTSPSAPKGEATR